MGACRVRGWLHSTVLQTPRESLTTTHCWRVGWEDADTELSESARRNRIIAEGGEEEFTETWGTLYDIGGDARVNGIPFDEHRTNDLRRETMSESEMQAELERLRAENAQLKSKDKGGLTLKVSEKGGVSLYGMGRFPVTLYKEQWLRILASAPEIEAFIRENASKLKTKE